MFFSSRNSRVYLLAKTAFGFGLCAAAAQTATTNNSAGTVNLDLGSVQASGYNSGNGSAARSGTASTLFYEKGPFYTDVSVNYVSRSLFAVVSPAGSVLADLNLRDADNFTSARTTVDADLEYNLTPRVTFFAQARNLTNFPLEFTQSASSRYPSQRKFYDLDYPAGVRLKLGS